VFLFQPLLLVISVPNPTLQNDLWVAATKYVCDGMENKKFNLDSFLKKFIAN